MSGWDRFALTRIKPNEIAARLIQVIAGKISITHARTIMITLEDCLGFCDLTEEEILAIAEHERMPEIAAIAYGQYLLTQEHGTERICRMIVDDIRAAKRNGDCDRVRTLLHVLHHFLRNHPEAKPEKHPWHTVF